MKISLITVCLNSERTILDSINSVKSQTYKNIEHIFVDGGSFDNTLSIINRHKSINAKILSEKDNGIYDAINKGIKMAEGDIIGIINSDDVLFSKKIIDIVMEVFTKNKVDIVYGDSVFFKDNSFQMPNRYYDSSFFNFNRLKFGIMPAHTTLFCKKNIFKKVGFYNTFYHIASDFDFFCKLSKIKNLKMNYIKKPLVCMREGGKSNGSIYKILKITTEINAILKKNSIRSNYFLISIRLFFKFKQVFFVNKKLENKLNT